MNVRLLLVGLPLFIGCSIHSQSPIKEVAYDFTDHNHYDRPYARDFSLDVAAGCASCGDEDPEVVVVDSEEEARPKPANDKGDVTIIVNQ